MVGSPKIGCNPRRPSVHQPDMVQRPALSGARVSLSRPLDEAGLVARCQAGDPQALRRLFELERSQVHRLLYRLVGSNTHMDDLLQDTFLEVFRSLPSFRGESSLRTWIHRCAVRVAYAHFRKRARLPQLEPVPDIKAGAASPEEQTSHREAVRRLYSELDRLEVRQRVAFTLHMLEGRSLREIALVMDSTVPTAKVRVWRARRALHERAEKDPFLSEFLSDEAEQDKEVER